MFPKKLKKKFDFNPEHKKIIAGTDEEPFLFHISRGPQKGSLIVHIKIGIFFYELRLDRVFQTSCSFKCTNKSCKARSKMQLLAPELISTKVQTRTNGSRKNMYSVDRQEPKLLDVKNWKVIADICSQKHSIACEVDFFKHLRREFRVEQGEKGLLVNKQVVNKQVAENSKKAAQLVTSHFTNVAELFTLSKLPMFEIMIFKLPVTI